MRALWKKGKVISLRLDEGIFTVSQMVNNSAKMQFFAIINSVDSWTGVDLNAIDPLFCVSVGNVLIQRLGIRRVPEKEIIKKSGGFNNFFIKPYDNSEGYRLRGEFIWRGGKLVDVGKDCSTDSYYAPTVIEELTVRKHKKIILNHEFTMMYGDKDSKERILTFLKTGLNREPMRKKIFPELDDDAGPPASLTDLR